MTQTLTSSIEPLKFNLEKAVKELAVIKENDDFVISLYISMDSIKANLKFIERKILEIQRSTSAYSKADILRVIKILEDGVKEYDNEPKRSLACFIRIGEDPINLIVSLPRSIPSEVHIGSSPSLYTLAETKDIYHRYAVVLLRTSSARIIQVNAGEITRNLLMGNLDLRSKIGRQISRDQYANRKKERGVQFMKEKINVLDNIIRDNDYDHIILAGDMKLIAQFKDMLPNHLLDKVLKTNVKSNVQSFEEVLEMTIATFIETEEQESRESMDELRKTLFRGGLAVTGYETVLEALQGQQLDKLLISKDSPEALREEILKLAIQQEIEIETIDDNELYDNYEGFSGFLRYRTYK